jgi:excinuclease Cho
MIHLPSGLRPTFDLSRDYEYPAHLRDSMDGLPTSPGVYIFHGEDGDLPLYIGKSVNLRLRVLSHLRNPEEARLLRQSRRISHIGTVGEIGALLLESRLIKEQQPLMNQKLRRIRQLCSLRLAGGVPEVVYSNDLNFATEPDLYGLFPSRHAALDALRDLADQHRLCYGALGPGAAHSGATLLPGHDPPMRRRLPRRRAARRAPRPLDGGAGDPAGGLLALCRWHWPG